VLRWIARLTSLASLGFLALFMIFEDFNPAFLRLHEWVLGLFSPLGVALGLILAWRRELLGGVIAVASLVGFYVTHYFLTGNLPHGGVYLALAAPGFLFLLSGVLSKSTPTG
jgi:hypothetical protein